MTEISEIWLTTGEASDLLGWSQRTVLRACEDGSLKATRLRKGGQWRIPQSAITAILEAVRPFKRTRTA